MAIQRSVRALDGVERIGRLLTLDLKSNDLKVSDLPLVTDLLSTHDRTVQGTSLRC